MRQVFVPSRRIDAANRQILLAGSSFHHLIHVLRKKKGDELDVFDGRGNVYRARLEEIAKDQAVLAILREQVVASSSGISLTLAVAMLKGKKMQWLVQKATEVGVHTIVPLATRRTIVKPQEDAQGKISQWEKVAVEAAQQCGRAFVPNIHHPIRWADFIAETGDFDAKILAWEEKGAMPFKTWAKRVLPALKDLPRPAGFALVIGPEGGFDDGEVEEARKAGFEALSFGPDVLRSETAAIVASAITLYEAN